MSVEQLDSIVACGQRLGAVIDRLDRTHLRSLADRLELGIRGVGQEQLRVTVKRRIIERGSG